MTIVPGIGGDYRPTGDGNFNVYSITADPSTFCTIYLHDMQKRKIARTFSWPTITPPDGPLSFYREQTGNSIIVVMFGENRESAQGIIDPKGQTFTMQWDKSGSGGIFMDANISGIPDRGSARHRPSLPEDFALTPPQTVNSSCAASRPTTAALRQFGR